MPTVLLADGDRSVLELLDAGFRAAGFETVLAGSGGEALAAVAARVPDIVVLELALPNVSGTEVCRRIRADPRTRAVPIVICTARGDEADRVAAFELGADDYVTKPFSMRELVSRLRAILRRAGGGASTGERPPDRIGPVRIDVDAHRCWVHASEIDLTPTEFQLLVTLTARAGQVQSRERLLTEIWRADPGAATRTLDTHVKRLREKLGSARRLLETVRGVGYRFLDPDRAP